MLLVIIRYDTHRPRSQNTPETPPRQRSARLSTTRTQDRIYQPASCAWAIEMVALLLPFLAHIQYGRCYTKQLFAARMMAVVLAPWTERWCCG
jgi:hypothetical protein